MGGAGASVTPPPPSFLLPPLHPDATRALSGECLIETVMRSSKKWNLAPAGCRSSILPPPPSPPQQKKVTDDRSSGRVRQRLRCDSALLSGSNRSVARLLHESELADVALIFETPPRLKMLKPGYRSGRRPTALHRVLMALFQVAKQNYAKARQKSESPNACYSTFNGISHAGHITGEVGRERRGGWDLGRKGIFKSEFSRYKTQEGKLREHRTRGD